MNKHGFTLIEVITVIFIIGMLFLIAIPPITKSVKDTTNELYDKQLLNIKVAASNWVTDNLDKIPEDGSITIKLEDLKKGGYVDEEVANPKTGKEFDNDMKITITPGKGNDLIYEIDKDTIKDNDNQDSVNNASIVLNGEQIEYVELRGTYTENKNVTVTDKNGNDITASTTVNVTYKHNGTIVSSIDTSSLTQYQVIYSTTVDGITSSASKNVIIRDTTAPTIAVDGKTSNYTVEVDLGSAYTAPNASKVVITDNSCSATCNITPNISGSVNPNVAGVYKVTYSATDSSGNTSKIVLTVKVGTDPIFTFETPSVTSAKKDTEFTYTLNLSKQEYSDMKITKDDFTINKTGSANATITEVNQNGYKYEIVLVAGTGDGKISITPKANIVTNISGNKNGAGPTSATVTIDNTVPTINFSPTPQNTCNSANYVVTVSSTDNDEVATFFTCKTTGNNGSCTPTTAGTPSGTAIDINTDNNYHLICAKAIDKAGNITNKCSNEGGKYYVLNKTELNVTTSISPSTANGSNGWYKTLPTITVGNTTSGCANYTGYKYQISTDNGSSYGSLSSLQTNDTALNNEIASNECKPIKYKVTGYDSNNNASSTITSATFKYDKTAPTITVEGHTSNFSTEFIYNGIYANGTPIYFNPVSGEICDDYVAENSLNNNKTGCMKWYIFNDEASSDTVDMILDHNIESGGQWHTSADNSTGPSKILTQLHTDTDGWTGVPERTDTYTDPLKGYEINYSGYRARLIEANEVAKITGADKALQWDSAKSTSWFYLDGKYGTSSSWQTQVAKSQGASKYAWLYDYTTDCTSYGCNVSDISGFHGYWTSSAVAGSSNCAWRVAYTGSVYVTSVGGYSSVGVRPVITIDKDLVPASVPMVADENAIYEIPTGTATDNCSTPSSITTSGSVNTSVLGSYPVNYSTTDEAGNSKTLTMTVNVVDKTTPIIKFNPEPLNACNSNDIQVTISAKDDMKVESFLWCQTTGNNSSCTPTTVGDATGTLVDINTDNQYHVICVQATDSSNNITKKCSNDGGQYYALDKTGPTVNTSISPSTANGSNGWYKTLPTVTVGNTTSGCSTYTGYKYQISNDGGSTYGSLSSLQTNNTALNNEIAQNECKLIKYKVTGYDENNRASTTVTSDTFKYDKTAPSLSVDGHTNDYSVEYVYDEQEKEYSIGDELYYNPVAGETCKDYVAANSLNENKTGCMRWYVLNYNATNSTYDIILDHNTTYGVLNSAVSSQLANDTSNWQSGLNPRIILADEVAELVGNDNWDPEYPQSAFSLSTHPWLYDHTSGCTSDGCKTEDSNVTGYWTISEPFVVAIDYMGIWTVESGKLGYERVDTGASGIRPIITIDKSITVTTDDEFVIPSSIATDNCQDEIEVVVSGHVNTELSGDYQLTYTATDLAGNQKSITVNVKIKRKVYARQLEYSNTSHTTCSESQCAIDELFGLLQ